MKLELFNTDEYCKDLLEITNPKIYEFGKLSKNGLFSQQIFGPIRSYYCACPKTGYHGRNSGITTCKACGVDITSSEERKRRFAKISLPFEVMNPTFLYILAQVKPSLKNVLSNCLIYKHKYYFDKDGNLKKLGPNEFPDPDTEVLEGLSGVKVILNKYLENAGDTNEINFIRKNLDKLTIKNVIVIPPDFRPYGKNEKGTVISDEINYLYTILVARCNTVRNIPYKLRESDEIYKNNFKHIQISTIKIYDHILSKMSKKEGLIRSNILGKRVDFSGRAVASPNPELPLDTCALPYLMLLEIQRPQLVAYMVDVKRICKRYNQASKMIDEAIKNESTELFEIVEDFCKDKLCILNRQPTLHRLGVLGFKVKPHLGNTIQVNPLVCTPYNLDFDGDCMAVYFPVTIESKRDVVEKIGIWKNMISPTDLSLVPIPNQDIILGIWDATTSKNKNTRNVKGKELPFELALFNECLPEDYPIVDYPCNKKKLIEILNDIAFKYIPTETAKVLDKIKILGFTLSTLKGYTLGLDDLYNEELENLAQTLTGNMMEDIEKLESEETMQKLRSLSISSYIDSGARGSWDQARQLVLSRGYVSGSDGRIRKELIRSSLVKGLTPIEFCNSSWGSRKGLLDTAMTTGDSGYLTRQLIYSTVHYELDEDCDDCGTTDTNDIYIEDLNMAKTLLWRYYIKDDLSLKRINKKDLQKYVGKNLRLRSPIYCRNKKICKKCYGDLHTILHSNSLGIIASEAIGERLVQLVLRSFHTSGIAKADKNQEGKQDDIVSGLTVANKLFHTPGEVLENVHSPSELTALIYKLFNRYKSIHMVHYEIIISSMMWTSDKKQWRLVENRDQVPWKWTSILKVPSYSSWLLAAAFSNLKNRLIEGIMENKLDEETTISRIFRY